MDQEALALLKEISAKIDTLISLVESRMPPKITRNISVSYDFSSYPGSSSGLTSEDYLNPFLYEGGLPDKMMGKDSLGARDDVEE